jgi:hypothetical protein
MADGHLQAPLVGACGVDATTPDSPRPGVRLEQMRVKARDPHERSPSCRCAVCCSSYWSSC